MLSDITISSPTALLNHKSKLSYLSNHRIGFFQVHFVEPLNIFMAKSLPSSAPPLKCGRNEDIEDKKPVFDPHKIDSKLVQEMAYDALVWSSLRGLVVGNRNSQGSAKVPGIGLVHAPISLLPMLFPKKHWKQACEVAPIFNELIDRVSLDGKFLQDSLSRTKNVDAFTSRLLDIHTKLLDGNKKEVNTKRGIFIFRSLLHQFKQHLTLDPGRIPQNNAVGQFAEALAKAWIEYNNPSYGRGSN